MFCWSVRPDVWNPYPYLRIFLAQKTGWIDRFFRNFCKLRPISKGFSTSKMVNFTFFFFKFCEMGPSSKNFFDQNEIHVYRFLVKKVTHLGGIFLYALTCEYPPGECDSHHYTQGVWFSAHLNLANSTQLDRNAHLHIHHTWSISWEMIYVAQVFSKDKTCFDFA